MNVAFAHVLREVVYPNESGTCSAQFAMSSWESATSGLVVGSHSKIGAEEELVLDLRAAAAAAARVLVLRPYLSHLGGAHNDPCTDRRRY